MRDLTITELDAELAEQLPARELMGGSCHRSCNCCDGGGSSSTATSGNSTYGLINVANGNNIQVLTVDSTNGNYAAAS
jgi:hypothetical protein